MTTLANQAQMVIPLTLPPTPAKLITTTTYVRIDSDGLWHKPYCPNIESPKGARERFGEGYYRADVTDVHDFPIGGVRAIGACCKPS